MPEKTMLDNLIELGRSFQGVDIQYRRGGTKWPADWKVQLFSCKHEYARIVVYGNTLEEAIENLNNEYQKRGGF
jgi:hypothetical protein